MTSPEETPQTLGADASEEPTHRERLAVVIEERLDIPMAVLAVVWALLVAYDLVAPEAQRDALALAGNVIWGVFLLEFAAKLWVSGHPLRFVRRRWPSVVFLILPALRFFRVLRAVRALRVLPAARVVGSSYRAVGTARNLLQDRLVFLLVATVIAVWSGGQLLYLTERNRPGGVESLGDALWWSANAAIGANLVHEPVTLVGRMLSIVLVAYSVVVFASVAAALGAFFIESRAEKATLEDEA
jgi:voltage-gated potassium channel